MFSSKAPAEEKVYTRSYKSFKGVDLTSAVTEVDPARSPYAPNMIASLTGFPQKRAGYTLVDKLGDARVNGMHKYLTATGIKKLVVHIGTELFSYEPDTPVPQPPQPRAHLYIVLRPEDAEPKRIYSNMNNARSSSFVMGGKLYILDGQNYLVWDGVEEAAKSVESVAYTPTISIKRTPSGAGEDYEEVNLLQPKRINDFVADGTSTVYQLNGFNIDSVVSCEYTQDGETWTPITNFTVQANAGTVTFATAPQAPPGGMVFDNVRITFSKTVAGYADRIKKCCINVFYGINNDHRVFVAGNPNYRNQDWYSASNNPTYFPDLGYSIVGSESNAIMGYLKQYGDLIIVKQANDQDATIYLRSAELNSENDTVFSVRQGLAGVGAASRYCFGTLYDDNIFLTYDGVFGLDTSKITMQRTAQARSYYINQELIRETELEEAVSCTAKGYYYLFVNGHVYVADSRQKNQNDYGSFGYEWYYWTDVPARCVVEYDGDIYFGTKTGEVHKFKIGEAKYGMDAYSDNGSPIYSAWATKMDTLGDCSCIKKIQKSGTGVLVMPFAKASGKIYYVTEGMKEVRGFHMNTEFDFDNIDFDDFDFGVLPYPTFAPSRKKDRKAKMFQMVIENNEVNEAFGLYEIKVDYTYAKDIKR